MSGAQGQKKKGTALAFGKYSTLFLKLIKRIELGKPLSEFFTLFLIAVDVDAERSGDARSHKDRYRPRIRSACAHNIGPESIDVTGDVDREGGIRFGFAHYLIGRV